MKTAIRVGIGVLAMALLCTGSALAKKDKKGGSPQVPPVITAEQAKATISAAIPKLTVGKPFSKQGKQGEWKIPLLYKGAIIAEMGVHGQDGSILPDWKASKDATMFGK